MKGCNLNEETVLSDRNEYFMPTENKAVKFFSLFACIVLLSIITVLFGLNFTTVYRIQLLEEQIHEVKRFLNARDTQQKPLDLPMQYTEGYVNSKPSNLQDVERLIRENTITKRDTRGAADYEDNAGRREFQATTDYSAYRSTDEDYYISSHQLASTSTHTSRRSTYPNYRFPLSNSHFEPLALSQEQESNINIRNRMRKYKKDRQIRRTKLLPAIHFHGDTSRYTYGEHDNYNGNGHLHHPNRLIVDWTAHDWVRDLGMDQHFSLDEGSLTIRESGLYFIYAQIYYIDSHDSTGFSVNKNGRSILQCARDTKSLIAVNKTNTCYTAGADFFYENDRISIEENYHERYSVFKPGKSFFGAIKLGDAKP